MRAIARRVAFAAGMLGMAFAVHPVSAQPSNQVASEASWATLHGTDRCAIVHYDADGLPFLILGRVPGNGYSVGGTFLDGVEVGPGKTPDIRAVTPNGSVVLAGPNIRNLDRIEQPRANNPIRVLGELLGTEERFILNVGGIEYSIALDGFDAAYKSLDECSALLDKSPLVSAGPQPARLTSFDGMQQLGAEASRQRLLSEKIGYSFVIDAQGKATECELSRDFRRRAVTIALCRPFLKHATFEPARNAQGNAIEGTFSIEVDFRMWMTQRGYLEPEVR